VTIGSSLPLADARRSGAVVWWDVTDRDRRAGDMGVGLKLAFATVSGHDIQL
jgi:hypothetical protein